MNFMMLRSDDIGKLECALHDCVKYAELCVTDNARTLDVKISDDILVDVMGVPLRASCGAACVVTIADIATKAIGRLRKIHPPSHITVISSRYKAYDRLIDIYEDLPIFKLKQDYKWNAIGYRIETI